MKIIATLGLIASGKTTWSKEQQTKDPSIVRVNKDELRAMMHDSRHNKSNESQVIRIETAIIEDALKQGRTVIVDNTHGHPSHQERFEKLAKEYNSALEIKEFDTPLATCIERDSKREKPIGKQAIMKMYNQFFRKEALPIVPLMAEDKSALDAWIVDIDGSLATMRNRGPFEWNKVGNDLPNLSVIRLVQRLNTLGTEIFIFSGRDGVCRDQTKEWLLKNNIPYNHLVMRTPGDMRRDTVVKKEMFEEHIKNKYNLIGIIDDRPVVCKMWRTLLLPVFQVGDPENDF